MQGSTLSAPTRVDGDHRLAYHPGTTRQEEAPQKGRPNLIFIYRGVSQCVAAGRWQPLRRPFIETAPGEPKNGAFVTTA